MMTHASLNNLANAKLELFTGNLLSCGIFMTCAPGTAANSRSVFATTGSPSGSGSGPEKDDDEKKKEEEKKKKEKEEEEKKKKDEEEKEKKKKKEKEEAESEDEEEEDIETTKERIGRMAKSAAESSEKIAEQMKLTEKEQQSPNAEKMRQLNKEMNALNAADAKVDEPTRKYLDELVTSKKIPKGKAKKLLNLDPLDEKFESKFKSIIKGIPGLEATSPEVKKIKELKEKEAEKIKEIDKKLKEAMSKMRELTNELGEFLIKKADQEKAKKRLGTMTGLNLKPGQVLTYHNEEDKEKKEKKKKYATIKEVGFEELEILDDEGNVVKKIPSTTPKVVVESINPETNAIEKDTFNAMEFHEWVDQNDVLEDIDSMDKLKKSIGCEIKKGNIFEFEETINPGTKEATTVSQKVEIKDINDKNLKIYLDKEVITASGKTKELSFDQFAKWFKQKEAVPQIETIEKLRTELSAHREVLNTIYERDAGKYPAIEAKDGEVLYYDDGSNRQFVIKKVDEKGKKIIFDNGQEKTFAGFLSWVKKNEVEKKSPDAEAKKQTELIADPKEKAAKEELVKKNTEKEMEERKKQGEKMPPDAGLPDVEEAAHHSVGALTQLWRNTHFLSINDLGEIGKTIWELIKRRWGRRQKGRVGVVGQMMFGHNAVGAEFKSLAQSAENEEVNHHVHVMETMGIADVKAELHHPPDKDTLKAAITVMCKKGQMRWDDHHFWHALQHLGGKDINPVPPKYLEDIEAIIDGWWGQDTFLEFRRNQDSSYKSVKGGFMENAKRLENDPSGLKGELKRLLFKFIKGEYVNPCQYEAYLAYAIDAGKMGFEDKMFFLLMGVAAQNGKGETLLHLERVAELDGDYLAKVPLIEFFTSPWLPMYNSKGEKIWDAEKGEYKQGRPDVNTFKFWMKKYVLPEIPGGSLENLMSPDQLYWKQEGKQGSVFADFVRDEIAWDPWAKYRAEKASRDPSNWDHDDMDMFVQLMDEGSIEQLLRYSGGARLQVSFTGLKNSFAGLNEFIKRKIIHMNEQAEKGNKEEAQKHYAEVIRMLKAFIRFDAIVSSRYEHGQTTKVRFSDDMFNSKPLCAGDNVIEFINDIRGLVKNISEQVGMGEDYEKLMEKIPTNDKPKGEAQHAVVGSYGGKLQANLQKYIDEQGIEKLAELLSNNKLRGLTNKITDRSADAAAKAEAEAMKAMAAAKPQKAANDNAVDLSDLSEAA